jgi:hypothetical protein
LASGAYQRSHEGINRDNEPSVEPVVTSGPACHNLSTDDER